MEELMRELKGVDHRLFFSIGHSLPDCFNIPIEEALKDESLTHILICEDDMILPRGILKEMIKYDYPVVALDYPFISDGDATTLHDPEGYGLYTGTGFMLIMREVLDAMPKPIFRTDTAWDSMLTTDNEMIFFPRDVSNIKTYGLHDVHFGLTLWSADCPIFVPKRTAGQRKILELGKKGVNVGQHDIVELTKVWTDNVTKNEDPLQVIRYIDRIRHIEQIDILDHKPDYIYYEGNQPRARGRKNEII